MGKPRTCASEWDKDSGKGEYLKDCTCMKVLIDDLVVKCNETEDIPERASINPSNGISYWLIAVVLLPIKCVLSPDTIIVEYCMKCGLRIPCLFW